MQRYNYLGHRQVVGCIPYRYCGKKPPCVVDEEEIEVLVITSQRKEKGMLFPKGGWEIDESIEAAALRETVEEAGVVGDVEQLEFWPEKDVRQRIWVSVREARKVCQYWWMKEALELLVSHLTCSGRANSRFIVFESCIESSSYVYQTSAYDMLRVCSILRKRGLIEGHNFFTTRFYPMVCTLALRQVFFIKANVIELHHLSSLSLLVAYSITARAVIKAMSMFGLTIALNTSFPNTTAHEF
ncbi:hypothetical protein SASPL_135519 [Salvia splendens]|uniref:Nudix hydrolase domain-containing protein n=1 Tax=Salvia splendens TaxID=180675 RepID=A0A8X8ZFJ8_SALSN|nr:hypothetical protein SASPL_135519 [Salvia splendens]